MSLGGRASSANLTRHLELARPESSRQTHADAPLCYPASHKRWYQRILYEPVEDDELMKQ